MDLHLDDIDLDAGPSTSDRLNACQHDRTGQEWHPRHKDPASHAPSAHFDHLVLNRDDEPSKEWGVQHLLNKYCDQARLIKGVTPPSLRHTSASYEAQSGVSPFQLKDRLEHGRLDIISIHVHMATQNSKKFMEAASL